MYTYVYGSTMADYAIGDIISDPKNVKGLKDYPLPPDPSGIQPSTTAFHMMYSDIRPLYGDPITDSVKGPKLPVYADDPTLRHDEGFWVLEIEYDGNSFNGNPLDYVQLKDDAQPEYVYYETGRTKPYTVVGTYHYVDWDIVDVKFDLKMRTRNFRDQLVASGYEYKGMDSSGKQLDIILKTDASGMQMLNNFYTQAVNGAQLVSLYLSYGKITLTGDQMIELFNDMMSQTDGYYTESETQCNNIDAVDNNDPDAIYKAQMAATWLYNGNPPPRHA